tara:strand:- start:428 stop:931 length:504 start_codon:yes stop_codon:yes gene_type:complete
MLWPVIIATIALFIAGNLFISKSLEVQGDSSTFKRLATIFWNASFIYFILMVNFAHHISEKSERVFTLPRFYAESGGEVYYGHHVGYLETTRSNSAEIIFYPLKMIFMLFIATSFSGLVIGSIIYGIFFRSEKGNSNDDSIFESCVVVGLVLMPIIVWLVHYWEKTY